MRGRLIWMRGVGTQGYSGRRVSNTTAVPPAFPFPPWQPSLVLPPPSPRSMYVCPSFLTLLGLLLTGEWERVREKERERAAALPPVSLVVLYLSSLTSTRACHLCESTEILINSYCDKGSSLFSRTVLLLDIWDGKNDTNSTSVCNVINNRIRVSYTKQLRTPLICSHLFSKLPLNLH